MVALVAAAAVVPAAAASHKKHARHVRLSLVPLQTAQLGPAEASLPIGFDSGWVSNGLAPPSLKKLGRVNGYLLDYGDLTAAVPASPRSRRKSSGSARELRSPSPS